MSSKKNQVHVESDQKSVTLPFDMYERVELDIKRFNINKNSFMNRIITNTQGNRLDYSVKIIRASEKNKKIEFRLNKENFDNYEEIFGMQGSNSEEKLPDSEIIRNALAYYVTLSEYRREQLIYQKEIDMIEEAIEKDQTISIKYQGTRRTIEPYFLVNSKEESYNYVYGFCKKNSAYRTYRLSNLSEVIVRKERQEMKKELLKEQGKDYLKNLKINYDPFLSYQKRVKVKFTEEGERLFGVIHYNRPKELAKGSNGEMLVECSEQKAIAYFSQFIDEVEILEPLELREKFKKRLTNASKKYK